MARTPDKQASEDGNGHELSLSEELLAETYDVLRRIASRQMNRQRPSATLNTTMIVHEAWLKLSNDSDRRFADQDHYFATASRAMRQVLVDHARRKLAKKHQTLSALSNAASLPALQSMKQLGCLVDPFGLSSATGRGRALIWQNIWAQRPEHRDIRSPMSVWTSICIFLADVASPLRTSLWDGRTRTTFHGPTTCNRRRTAGHSVLTRKARLENRRVFRLEPCGRGIHGGT